MVYEGQVLLTKQRNNPQRWLKQKYFHNKLTVKMGKYTCNPETGVPQGALTSPSFFDIYSETLLILFNGKIRKFKLIKFKFNGKIIVLAYADDMAFIIRNESDIDKVLKIIEEWAATYNMKVNKAKSGIMPI